MRTPLPKRRRVGGVPGALLVVLLVLARLLAPAMAMPQAGSALAAFDQVAREAICHVANADAGANRAPGREAPAGHDDCLLCPACHLAAAAALPAPAGPDLPIPVRPVLALSAPPPPATGPPLRRRTAAPPTGPPARSA